MNYQDIANILKDTDYSELIKAVSVIDPNLYQVIVIIEEARRQGYGIVEIRINGGKIVLANYTKAFKIS